MPDLPKSARIFDVTLPLSPDLPVWPGDPAIEVAPVTRIADGDEANVSRLSLSSHSGTHVDAPWHFIAGGAKLDAIAPERWIGPCRVVAIPGDVTRIEPAHLEAAEIPPGTERLLFKTANSARWVPGKLDFVEDYVAFSPAAARWVVAHGIRLVGIDYLSIEGTDDPTSETHRTLLGHDVLIIENLNLSGIVPGPYTLICLPLRLMAGDGAPARVLLVREGAGRDDA